MPAMGDSHSAYQQKNAFYPFEQLALVVLEKLLCGNNLRRFPQLRKGYRRSRKVSSSPAQRRCLRPDGFGQFEGVPVRVGNNEVAQAPRLILWGLLYRDSGLLQPAKDTVQVIDENVVV